MDAVTCGVGAAENTLPVSYTHLGLFTKANIPRTPYSRGFSLEMDREVAKVFINVDRGFTRYIKEIALRAQSRYTIQKHDILCKKSFLPPQNRKNDYLSNRYFEDVYKRQHMRLSL